MKTLSYFLLWTTFLSMACKEKKTESDHLDISVLSIIKGQINHLDTSFYQIKKIETKDGRADTSFLKREEVRTIAKDFLSLPDITGKDFKEKYTEERLIDNDQNTLSIITTAKNDEQEIRKQLIIVPLNELATGRVQSIFFDRFIVNKDSSIEQKLFWQIDKFFQVGTIVVKENLPEKTNFFKVVWE